MKKDISMLFVFVVAFHISSYKLHLLVDNEEAMWSLYNASQSLVLFTVYFLLSLFTRGVVRRVLMGWSFFLIGEVLDEIYFYKVLEFNFGFLTLIGYVAWSKIKYWKNKTKEDEVSKSIDRV